MSTGVLRSNHEQALPAEREMLTYVTPEDSRLRRSMIRMVENLSGRRRLTPLYKEIMTRDLTGREVWKTAVELLQVNTIYDQSRLDAIPREGPLVFVANHPFGVVDGLILGSLAAEVRSEFHFLVNEALVHQDERLDDFLLPIDFRETKEALQTNIASRRASVNRLKSGEALVIFPGGGVATAKNGFGRIREFEWKRFVASVIQKSKATVVPIYFHGRNSRAFSIISQFSQSLRLGMLLHEVKNKIGKDVHIEIGQPLPYSHLQAFQKRQELLDHLFEVTMALGRKVEGN